MTSLSYKIEFADYTEAARLHSKTRKGYLIMGWIIILLAVFMVVLSVDDFIRTGKDLGPGFGVAVGLAYLCYHFAFLLPRRLKRAYEQHKLLREEGAFQTSDTHFMGRSTYGESTLPWSTFCKWKYNESIILVYLTDSLYHIFPRRAFGSAEELASFKTLLTEKIGPPKK